MLRFQESQPQTSVANMVQCFQEHRFNFFLDAPGETGKSSVTKSIQHFLSRGKHTLAVATFANAAQLDDSKRLSHSV